MAGRGRRWLRVLGVFLVVGVAADQALQFTLLADGELLQRRIAPFDPPLFNPGQRATFARYESFAKTGQPPQASFRMDPDLGWAPQRGGRIDKQHFDELGCRVGPEPLPLARRDGVRRVLTLGCSFTLGEEVEDDETWVWQLDAALDDHEFANLAMSAYGLDQALLRYRRDGRALAADEVWLGWLPVASNRVLTVYRPAQRHWAPSAVFKPRFRLRDGELELVPCPVADPAQAFELLGDQDAFLAALGQTDHWVASAPRAYAARGSSLLHYTALGRLALTALEGRGRDHRSWLRNDEDDRSRLLLAIVETLAREVAADGARFRLLVLPDRDDLARLARGGAAYWAPFVGRLRDTDMEVVDCSAALSAIDGAGDDACWAPGGHYSAKSNAAVAASLAAAVAE